MKSSIICNRIIAWLFYALFFFVPLILSSKTSELFEFNKMWLTYGIAICIAAAWFSKMLIEKRFFIQKTPMDIPLLLFLVSQLISTIFSWDQHISLWGYYSRFNGGLLSLITYVFLYYAFVSNLSIKHVFQTLLASFISGLFVALWGFPSHFGKDPTCLLFRHTLDTSCWTDAFKPTVRTFSTLGQPAWLAAYLSILIPISIAYLYARHFYTKETKHSSSETHHMLPTQLHFLKNTSSFFIFYLLTVFFYINLVFSNTRAGFIGFWVANLILWGIIFFKRWFHTRLFLRYFVAINLSFVLINFIFGWPIPQLDRLSYHTLVNLTKPAQTQPLTPAPQAATPVGDLGGTDSGVIRLLVWQGAIDAWKAHPIFGTGVETFAFAYYQFRPAAHNMTSEWDYLYNKAHNEYLNYLTTTGIVGLGTYLAIIFIFLGIALHWILRKTEPPTYASEIRQENYAVHKLISSGLIAGYVSILISNFFGFSVVIINLYFFLIPAFVLMLLGKIHRPELIPLKQKTPINLYQWSGVMAICVVAIYLLLVLNRFWRADVAYALGSNLDHAGQYQQAYPYLNTAVVLRKSEPVFLDELSFNNATIAEALAEQKNATDAGTLANQAVQISNDLTARYPYNIVFWKDRVRIFFNLSQVDTKLLPQAIAAIKKVHELAPTDAKVTYNLGVLTGQSGDVAGGIQALNETIKLKPDYRDAYFALGLFYHDEAIDKNNHVINPTMEQKAVETMHYILDHLAPNDPEVEKTLKSWNEK